LICAIRRRTIYDGQRPISCRHRHFIVSIANRIERASREIDAAGLLALLAVAHVQMSQQSCPGPLGPLRHAGQSRDFCAYMARLTLRMSGKATVNSENGTLKVGARLRRARLSKGLRMRDLAQAVGCDESMISKIEAGKVMPSLPMLNKMVHALDRDMASFFGLKIDEYKLVQKPEDRLKVPVDALRGGTGVTYERLVPVAAGNLLEANVHVVAPGGEKVDLITHQGEAVGYLVSGTIELTIDDTTYVMTSGDSFFFKAYLTNSYRNVGPDEARIIWVNTPQVH
jgi:transcriptional regulator with XRE-family HTH domain